VKLLWGLAAARCGFPDCRRLCVAEATDHDPAAVVGKIAHVVAHSDTGPRGDPAYPADCRDSYENWILLCSHHHDVVDVQPNTYTIKDLKTWKADHEVWVRQCLSEAMPGITSAELEVVARGILASTRQQGESNFSVTAPAAKMLKNGLTDRVHFHLTLGLAKAREVAAFISEMAQLDATFPERLKSGFVQCYNQLRAEGLQGDGLFEGMVSFSTRGSLDFSRQAAGIAVFAYLFELCEIFER